MQIWYANWRRRRNLAVLAFLVSVGGGFSALPLNAGTIGFTFTTLGPNSFEYTYTLSGFDLLTNQAIDIQFDPAVYLALSNGVANSDFNLFLFQPNNPPGAIGDYLALSLIDHPSLAGQFRVDVSFVSGLPQPGSQPFAVEQFDSNGNFVSTISLGLTASPEPASGFLVLSGVVTMGVLALALRRFQRRPGSRALPSSLT